MDANQRVADAISPRPAWASVHNPRPPARVTRARPTMDVDWETVRRAKNGQREAFDLLVLKYQHRVLKIVSPYVGDRSEAMDVAQESFIRAYRALPGFRAEAKFSTWLSCIAANAAKNYAVSRKRARLERPLLEGDLASSHNDSPEHELLAEEIRQLVDRALDELSAELRTAITLREQEGLSSAERAARGF